ncbi:S-layer homology domain-containing protein [Tumebacillus permanentifrigoris]|uniref:S-layer family protein n=1 Tax=Tumebacillus permanentifrigoris TaxID=378543 RepID=A0A316DSW3_9BACL|nr:S-layer homology domain-containing protein [Tumebacillus permanentifrigoris]PWK09619.1 S-layer family protein [Tumebacillus permanentifrigoris]
MRFCKRFSTLLCLTLLVPLVWPTAPTTAAATANLVYTGIAWQEPITGYEHTFAEGDTVPRNFERLILRFDGQPVLRAATVTDSLGNSAPVSVYPYHPSSWYDTILTPTGPLKKNETYTITIPGGANGEHDTNGHFLANDLKVTFHTDDQPFTQSVILVVHPPHNFSPEIRRFRFYAQAGPLEMKLESLRNGGVVYARLTRAETGQVVSQPIFSGDPNQDFLTLTQTVTLPEAGYYDILMDVKQRSEAQDIEYQLTLTAPELIVAEKNYVPAIRLNMSDYEVHTDPFLPLVERYDTDYRVRSVQFYLDNQMQRELNNESASTSALPNTTVDTSGLRDGIHTFAMMAKGPFSENMGGDEKLIQVDRLDNFRDVPHNAWMHRAVELMSDLRIVSGVGNGVYEPDRAVTREEFAKIIATTLGLRAATGFANPFADVSTGMWSYAPINALAESGMITGDVRNGKRYFRPSDTITRAEAAAIIGRHLGVTAEIVGSYQPPFADYNAVPTWAKPHVAWLQYYGWLNGSNGYIYPSSTLTRAEAAQILVKYLGV